MAHISITTAAVGLVIMIGGASSIAAEPLIRAGWRGNGAASLILPLRLQRGAVAKNAEANRS